MADEITKTHILTGQKKTSWYSSAMSFRVHSMIGAPPAMEHVYQSRCRFCAGDLVWRDADWDFQLGWQEIRLAHFERLIEVCWQMPDDFMDNNSEFLDEPKIFGTRVGICPICGWWLIDKKVHTRTKNQSWTSHFGSSGALKNLDLKDLKNPLDEIRNYLAAKYDARFSIHPKVFEDVVGSVFSSIGYFHFVTAYSSDGGIDVILTDSSGATTGVQVKRHQGKIKAEQIRAFLGALVLANHTQGVFVTTSEYQKGVEASVDLAKNRGISIELFDADSFFDLLKIAQIKEFDKNDFEITDAIPIADLKIESSFGTHMNWL